MYVCICTTCVPATHAIYKRVSKPLKLELFMFLNHHVVLGMEPASSERAICALSC